MTQPSQHADGAGPARGRDSRQAPRRLPGMRDMLEAAYLRQRALQEALQGLLSMHGYRVVETPVLEPTEIFLRKSGGELAARMYTFSEPGGHRASLRPEFTSAVIRLYLEQTQTETGGQAGRLPVRWQYAGPVFRYERQDLEQPRQFIQVGAELIGASGPRAEAEVLALACQALIAQGLDGLQLILGDVGAVHALLRQFGLSERALLFLLESIGELKNGAAGRARVRQRAEELGLFRRPSETAASQDPPVVAWGHPVGVRTQEEVLARLRRKLQAGDAPERLEQALAFAGEIAQVRGAPSTALATTRRLAEGHALNPSPLDPLETTLEVLELHGLEAVEVVLDLGLARGIAYYTGIVFEVRHPASLGDVSLGGGGRYDGLMKALGGPEDVPALGFAWSLDRLLSVVGPNPDGGRPPRRVLVAPRRPKAYGEALKAAASLRLGGQQAELLLEDAPLREDLAYARSRGLEAVVTVDEDGTSQRQEL